jgi:Ca-activated chloride channel family protein
MRNKEDDMKNELNIRTVMSRDTLPITGSEQAVYALVDLKAAEASLSGGMPANFGLVLDRSGSMDDGKMEHLKEAVGYVLDRLGENDRISVMIFDDAVETLIPNQPVQDSESIKRAVGAVIARGGTQISDGLRAGLEQVRAGMAAGRVSRILLLTDGQTWDDEAACLDLADAAAKEGIAVTSIGIGDEWNDKLLLQIAERSRGNSHWIQDPIAILDAFRQEVEGMRSIALTNLKVSVRLSPLARLAKVHRTVPMITDISGSLGDGSAVLELGTLDSNRGQSLLFDIRVPDRKAGAFPLGRVEAVYDVPSRGITGQRAVADLSVLFSSDAAARVNPEVMNLVERVSAFKLQTRALADIAAGDLDAATRRLSSAATVLLDLGEDELAAAATREARELARTGSLTSSGTKTLAYGTRKLTRSMTKTMGS